MSPVNTGAADTDEAQTRALDPGIQPWTLRNMPQCDCHAWGYMCDQGRRCPRRPTPAEAATEVGADQADDALDSVLAGVARVAAAVVAILVIGLIAAAVVAPALQMLP